ncbi:uncharacterized protein LOC120326413 [Styela clava]|uniref:uncharacterized protein LOC120326413 n=1 Tax=Styela clava TaxID=7725 RepID=UPI00193A2D95|nr:uncharacterized protein LOC120326413 [Styela clava]
MATKASSDDGMEYREMMAKLAKRIDDGTLEKLKYQCRDLIGPGRLEKVANAQGLFEVLEERDELSCDNLEFLNKILNYVGRLDLCKIITSYTDYIAALNDSVTDLYPTAAPFNSNEGDTSVPEHSNTTSSKIFHPDGEKGPQKTDISHGTYSAVNERQNCTRPFDTSSNVPQHQQPSSNHNQMTGNRNQSNTHQAALRMGNRNQSNTHQTDPMMDNRNQSNTHQADPMMGNRSQLNPIGHAIPPQVETALELVISSIARGWQSAARHLGVPDVIIDSAQDNWPRNVRNQIREAFTYWARSDDEASVAKLIEAMRRSGRNDIADDLQYG